jgi:alkylated DNA repair dioxygenase AlkB
MYQLPFSLPQGSSYDWYWNETKNCFHVQLSNGELYYAPHFLSKEESDWALDYLLDNATQDWKQSNWRTISPEQIEWKNIAWRWDKIRMFGKWIPQPRYTAWYGDSDKAYTYSGLTMRPEPWNQGLVQMKEKIEQVLDFQYNSVLLNWYRDGQDHMSWHSDNEKELGKNPVIASLNFGASRRFLMRNNQNQEYKMEIPLHHGTLLIMAGETQHFWQHALPKSAKVKDTRVNLTFRKIQDLGK